MDNPNNYQLTEAEIARRRKRNRHRNVSRNVARRRRRENEMREYYPNVTAPVINTIEISSSAKEEVLQDVQGHESYVPKHKSCESVHELYVSEYKYNETEYESDEPDVPDYGSYVPEYEPYISVCEPVHDQYVPGHDQYVPGYDPYTPGYWNEFENESAVGIGTAIEVPPETVPVMVPEILNTVSKKLFLKRSLSLDSGLDVLSKQKNVTTQYPRTIESDKRSQYNETSVGERTYYVSPNKILYRGAYISNEGVIVVHITNDIRIDVSIDRSVRVYNSQFKIDVSNSALGTSACFRHPCGRVAQNGARIEVVVHDRDYKLELAKMNYDETVVTSDKTDLSLMVDFIDATDLEQYVNVGQDFAKEVFYGELVEIGERFIERASTIFMSNCYGWRTSSMKFWSINSYIVTENLAGLITITGDQISIKICSKTGYTEMNTVNSYMTASIPDRKLSVKKKLKDLLWNGDSFSVTASATGL